MVDRPSCTDSSTVLSPRHKLRSSEKKESQLKKYASVRLPCSRPEGHFLNWRLMLEGLAHCGQCPSLGRWSWVYNKAKWANQENKSLSTVLPWPLLQFLSSGSWLQFLSLDSFDEGLCCENKSNKPFLPKITFGSAAFSQQQKPN